MVHRLRFSSWTRTIGRQGLASMNRLQGRKSCFFVGKIGLVAVGYLFGRRVLSTRPVLYLTLVA